MRKLSISVYSALIIVNLAALLFLTVEKIPLSQKYILAWPIAAVCGWLISLLISVIEEK